VYGTSRYHIVVENPHGVSRGIVLATLDGHELSRTVCEMPLVDDGSDHEGRVIMG
jgi:cyclic beta-1,2-glucan synthetase